MITMQKKSPSYDQIKLKILCDHLCDNIEELLSSLGLECNVGGKMFTMSCPVHGGDNVSALNLYHQGDNYRGNWKCRTHNCEKYFKPSIIGFVRGVLSHQKYNWTSDKDTACTFNEALSYCTKFLDKDLDSIVVSKSDREKSAFTSLVSKITSPEIDTKKESKISRNSVRNSLIFPCKYFIDRGVPEHILDKYDVGLCDKPHKEMYNRAVVPIYDKDYSYLVGCTGRIIYNRCDKCGSYHDYSDNCPISQDQWKYSKWKHSFNFKTQNHLYNLYFAKEYILMSNTVILVESPGNVWKLEENNIHNSVAIFGSSLSDRQKMLLDSSGAMNIMILTDNDDAGLKAAEQIKLKCQNTYRIFIPKIIKPDVGEMSSAEIDNEIRPILEKII